MIDSVTSISNEYFNSYVGFDEAGSVCSLFEQWSTRDRADCSLFSEVVLGEIVYGSL